MTETTSATATPDSTPQTRSLAASKLRWLVATAVCFTFATCYLREFVLPHIPVISWADQMLFSSNGARIVQGQMPYRDYFQFVTPGTDLAYAFLFRHLGLWLWIPNMLMVCLASAGVLLMMLAATKVLRGRFVALPAALTVGFVLFGGMDATHHWFSSLAAMLAMLILFKGSQDWRIALAGVLCGIAASFTQSKGATVTAGFLIYLLWQSSHEKQTASVRWRRSLLLCGATLAAFLAINGPFMLALGLKEWFKWVVVFTLRYYPTLPAQTWRSPPTTSATRSASSGGSAFRSCTSRFRWSTSSFCVSCTADVRAEPDEPWNQLLLLAITGLAMFLAVAPCLSVMRVSSASLPGMVLLAWLLNRWGKQGRIAAGALAALSLAIALYLPVRNQTMRWHYLDLPAGRTAILDPTRYEIYRWMAQNTHPGQMYFGVGPLALPLWLQTPGPDLSSNSI